MKFAVEMGSGAMFHKDWFSHSKVDRGKHRQTESIVIS
jgi:hypothetical protein